jgi:hypothetical protein
LEKHRGPVPAWVFPLLYLHMAFWAVGLVLSGMLFLMAVPVLNLVGALQRRRE